MLHNHVMGLHDESSDSEGTRHDLAGFTAYLAKSAAAGAQSTAAEPQAAAATFEAEE